MDSLADRFVLVDQALDGSPRFLTRSGSWSPSWADAALFWTVEGARNAVPWHDLDHCRVRSAQWAFVSLVLAV